MDMQTKTLYVFGPETVSSRDQRGLRAQIVGVLRKADTRGMQVAGYPDWLVSIALRAVGGAPAPADARADAVLVVWDGLEHDESAPYYERSRAMAQTLPPDRVLQVRIYGERGSEAQAPLAREQEAFPCDAFVLTCPEDAAAVKRLADRMRRFAAPKQIAQRVGYRTLARVWVSEGRLLSLQEQDLLPRSRELVVCVSKSSPQYDKINQAAEAFAQARGMRHIQLALVDPEKTEKDAPHSLFPDIFRGPGQDPLAADFRRDTSRDARAQKQSDSMAFLRLMAPLFDSTYDELYRRRHQQRIALARRIGAWALGIAVLVAVTLFGLAQWANREEAQANLNRAEAERQAVEADRQASEAQAAAEAAEEARHAAQASAQQAREQADIAQAMEKDAQQKKAYAQQEAAKARILAARARKAANKAEEKKALAQSQETIAKQAAALARERAESARIAAQEAQKQADIAAQEAEQAQLQAERAAEAAEAAEKQAQIAEENREAAEKKAQEAVASNLDALQMQDVRLTREARLAAEDGDTLRAVSLLLDATPPRELAREVNAQAQAQLRTLLSQGEAFPVLTLTDATLVSTDGERFVARHADGSLLAYDVRTGQSEPAQEETAQQEQDLGRGILTAQWDDAHTFMLDSRGYGQLRDENGVILEDIKAHEQRPLGLLTQWMQAGRLVSYADTEIVLWALSPSNARKVIEAHNGEISQLWVGEERFATAGVDGRVQIFSLEGSHLQTINAGKALTSLEIQEALGLLVTCARDGTVSLFSLETGRRLWSQQVPDAGVARLDPEGRRVLAGRRVQDFESIYKGGDARYRAALLDAQTGRVIQRFLCNGVPWYGQVFREDEFVTSNLYDIDFRSLEDGALLDTFRFGYHERTSAIYASGGHILTFSGEGGMDRQGNNTAHSSYFSYDGPLFTIPSPTGSSYRMLVTGEDYSVMISPEHQVSGISTLAYIEAHRYRHRDRITAATFSPDGLFAATSSMDGVAAILTDDGLLQELINGYGVTDVAFLPDSSAVLTTDVQGRVVIWPLGDFYTARDRAEELMRK